ncbi:enoyl-CoA hydratase/isomerase family protein [Methylobacterium crusticola]|nr:enoyl-CoA hydratase/isomerase family protein [Methylobacterium crusticola]
MTTLDRVETTFDTYKDRFQTIRMERQDGILEMHFHSDGGPLRWSLLAHNEFEAAFLEVGRDRGNEVVIMTGTGDEFCGPAIAPGQHPNRKIMTPESYDPIFWESKQILPHLLAIEAPVISAINGPAVRHAEIPLVADIVLASETAYFQDTAHFPGGMVPGDGMHIIMPLLMGLNRGRYFLLTGQKVTAAEAQAMGLVAEVLPPERLLERARELGRLLLQQPKLVRRYTRIALTEELRSRMHGLLAYGLALEGMARMKS